MTKPITKAVIPAAGMGTRFLPATKAMPKEMLPVIDKPAIQYVVEEAINSGVSHLLLITGRNKQALENHFDRNVELETLLEKRGDTAKLNQINTISDEIDLHYVRQGNPLGLGHAVLKAETFVAGEPFALLLGDDIIEHGDELLAEMIWLAHTERASVIALMEVPHSQLSRYGVADISPTETQHIFSINGFVEKPEPEQAPSRLVAIGRYVLQPGVFNILKKLEPGFGGEIQLSDALDLMAKDSTLAGPVYGMVHEYRRFDTGDKLSYLKAIVQLAGERDDLGADFNKWLKKYSKDLM
jgi:UTP--glucose-1-phosphate uridylyltransferase